MITKNKIKELSKLSQKKFRKEFGKVVIEGERLIDNLILNKIAIIEIYINSEYKHNFEKYLHLPHFYLTYEQISKITSTKHPPTVAALIETKNKIIHSKKKLIFLDGISEPGNLGTIFRTASAFNIDGIILSPDCCEIFNPKVIRSSLGAVFTIPSKIQNHSWLEMQKSTIISTALSNSIPMEKFVLPSCDTILVFGSEANGISQEILSISDHIIKVTIGENMESLNVAVASGIVLHYFLFS
ncbi:MAG: RNA methyltransferase [Candidatus Cloacimonetes bacterium]|nr:RNA methyltransferase [Candidatus Cloacimonadota bacterium]